MSIEWWNVVPANNKTPFDPNEPWAVNHRNFWGKPSEPLRTLRSRRLAPARNLWVFSQYDTLYRRISEHRRPGDERRRILPLGSQDSAAGPVIVLGTPGIGKSVFVHYYAARLLRESIPFILYTYEPDGPRFLFFTPDSVWTAPPACLVAIVNAPGNPALNVPFLIDIDFAQHLPVHITHNGGPFFFLQAAYPKEGHYSWSKQIPGRRWFVMNPHPQEEMFDFLVYLYPSISTHRLRTVLEAFGPSFRTIIDAVTGESAVLQAITKAVDRLAPSQIDHLMEAATGPATHTLIVTRSETLPQSAADAAWLESDAPVHTIANPTVMRVVIARWLRTEREETLKLLRSFSTLPQTASTAGWLFESWCHTILTERHEFTLHAMTRQANGRYVRGQASKKIQLSGLPTVLFSQVPSPTDRGVYYVPLATNNPTYDSFCRVGNATYAFQMTLAKTHSLKQAGLVALKTPMGEASKQNKHFVFVVAKGRSFSFKPPDNIPIADLKFGLLYVDLDDSARSKIEAFMEYWDVHERDDDGMDTT